MSAEVSDKMEEEVTVVSNVSEAEAVNDAAATANQKEQPKLGDIESIQNKEHKAETTTTAIVDDKPDKSKRSSEDPATLNPVDVVLNEPEVILEIKDMEKKEVLFTQNEQKDDDNMSVTNLDDTNESQESLKLIIDEKDIASDINENSTGENGTIGQKETESKDDERMDSCEDTSEVSAVTQIDLGELDNDNRIPDEPSSENAAISVKTSNEMETNLNTSSSVIEIDDEDEEKSKDEEKLIEKSNNIPYAVAPKQTTETELDKNKEEVITIIEIDDEDEVETSTSISNAQASSVVPTKKESTTNDLSQLAMELDLESCSEKAVDDPTNNNNDDDVEMKNLIETKDTTEINVEESLLKETITQELSPAPAFECNEELEDNTGEIFYNKECINHECPGLHKQYVRVSQFALSYFKITKKKSRVQYICVKCYDKALDMYEELCGQLTAKQPLLLNDNFGGRSDIVEIIDSSDEDEPDDKSNKEKEQGFFSGDDLKLIEKELENSIKNVLSKVEIQTQLTWSKTILATRLENLQKEATFNDCQLRSLQKKADNMHDTLYQHPKVTIHHLPPLNLNSSRLFEILSEQELPPLGEIQCIPIQLNETYFAVKNKAIASWVPCKVIEQVDGTMGAQKNLKHYKIKFLKSQYQMLKTVSVKHLAYYEPPQVRLPIGTRVIAYFDATSLSRGKEKMMIQSAFYPGIIAEPLKPNNKFRYLIFYDDGYTQYVYHKDVRLVCHVSDNVWEDVHPGSRDFIQKYLLQYSINRPMVQAQRGQSMNTESNGKWIYARVVDIDCSLIQMQFEGPKCHTEWIYRGSMRLGPVFKEHHKTLQKDALPISRLPRRTEPFIRYTEDEENTTNKQSELEKSSESRAVAKKSTAKSQEATTTPTSSVQSQAPLPIVRHLNNSTIYVDDENRPKGKVVFYTAKRNLPPLSYKPHKCNSSCLFKVTHNLSAYSPLSKPLLSGWERMITRQKIKKIVTYRAPCGKIVRNMKELHHYLRRTDNMLNVDHFDFSIDINCLAEYVIESAIVQKRDISGGQEKMPIPLVNYYDDTMPPECKYSAQRIPTEGVNLNIDEEYLVGCDCEDDCSDKSKCSCWQLTYAGAKYGNPNTPMEEIGYQYKRLYEHVPTGLYECNSRCKCKSSCLNRVVQHSLQMKLQVFKTSNRGWGLRCINDVPKGSFICIYAGHLLTEAKANEGGLDAGDEYFAELDYIEVAEQIKEGYESDVEPPEPEEEEEEEEDAYAPDQDDDDEFTPSKSYLARSKLKSLRSNRGNQPMNSEDDSQERQMINFNPNADMNENSVRESSIRKLFGKDEACYVMDAKTIGNLGRYFNHSCAPNLFVQNVFVDTHDLRFPWVAFFALTNIRAGTELTWNYNYEVGVVPGKVLYCQCGAPTCRLRLL